LTEAGEFYPPLDALSDCRAIVDTHIHADHVTGGRKLKAALEERYNATVKLVCAGAIEDVANAMSTTIDTKLFCDSLSHGDSFNIGSCEGLALHVPGHTPGCMAYLIGDALFVGDTLFMPDFGTARCDFPGGCAETLYASVQNILSLPDEVRMFVGHDYTTASRDKITWETTVGEQKRSNIHVGKGMSRDAFVKLRTARDATLKPPRMQSVAVPANLVGGDAP